MTTADKGGTRWSRNCPSVLKQNTRN